MSNRTPLVSIIMIFLDGEPFIGEAIRSVFAQTHPHWELLLVNDGSSDGSTGTARGYAERHPDRVRYLEHPEHANRGMSASRNLGLANARGEYVAFLDADDMYLPHNLEHQMATLAACPEAGMVYGSTEYWHSWTGEAADRARDRVDFASGRGNPPGLLPPPELVLSFLNDPGRVPCMCSVLVRRETLRGVGGFEEVFRGMYEDQVLYAKMALRAPVLVTDTCLARYRQHPASCCAAAEHGGEIAHTRLAYLEWLSRYLRRQGINGPAVRAALRAQLWPLRHPVLHQARVRSRAGAKRVHSLIRSVSGRAPFA